MLLGKLWDKGAKEISYRWQSREWIALIYCIILLWTYLRATKLCFVVFWGGIFLVSTSTIFLMIAEVSLRFTVSLLCMCGPMSQVCKCAVGLWNLSQELCRHLRYLHISYFVCDLHPVMHYGLVWWCGKHNGVSFAMRTKDLTLFLRLWKKYIAGQGFENQSDPHWAHVLPVAYSYKQGALAGSGVWQKQGMCLRDML